MGYRTVYNIFVVDAQNAQVVTWVACTASNIECSCRICAAIRTSRNFNGCPGSAIKPVGNPCAVKVMINAAIRKLSSCIDLAVVEIYRQDIGERLSRGC